MIEWLLFKSGFVWISLDTQQEKKRAITLQASVSVERECVFLACSPARRSFGISYSRHTVKTSQSRRRTTVLISHHQRSHRPGPSISPHMCLHSRGLSSNDLNVFFCFFFTIAAAVIYHMQNGCGTRWCTLSAVTVITRTIITQSPAHPSPSLIT